MHAHQKLENSTLLTEFLHCLELMVRKRQADALAGGLGSIVTELSEPGGGGMARQILASVTLSQPGGQIMPLYY